MATREQLEQALINADRAGDVQAARQLAQAIKQGMFEDQPTPQVEQPTQQPEEQGVLERIDQAILDAPGGAQLAEIAAGFNRGVGGMIDALGVDPVNALFQLAGSDFRIPKVTEQAPFRGNFVEEGLQRDILRGAGEASSLALGATQLARGAAELAKPGGVGQRVLQQIGAIGPTADVTLGALSGAGAEIGEEIGGQTGQVVGAIAAPLAGQSFAKLLFMGKTGIQSLMTSVEGLSDDAAAKILAEKMTREGIGPTDVIRRMEELGPEAIPADIGNNFARLLRTASNEIPRIEGQAAQVLGKRQAGQAQRLASAFDDAGGVSALTVNDEILRINKLFKPQIDELYTAARSQDFRFSPKLSTMLEKSPSLAKASAQANKRLQDKEALGETITNLSKVDETKRVLDDQIGRFMRQGEKNKAMDLIKLKNAMVSEADEAIPEYAQARSLFAGKAELENAADLGREFVKFKPREVDEAVKNMGESERRLFKLGAKQAILDKVDSIAQNADLVKRLFGKNGDTAKLRALFDNRASFDQFNKALEREAQFIVTRRAAQANSTTTKQLADIGNAREAFEAATSVMQSPIGAASRFGQILSGLKSKKSDEAFTQALEQAGDILLQQGMNPKKLADMLRKGNAEIIENALREVMIKPSASIPALKSVIINETRDE